MKSYLCRFASGDGTDIVAIVKDVLERFETSARQGKATGATTRPPRL